MCTIHKSGTRAINFRLSLRRFWRPLQMRKRTMSNIIKVFPQKRCDSPPKLTMDRLPCHKCVIQGQVLFPWQPVPHVKMTSLFGLIYLFETCARSGWPLSTHNLSLYFPDPLFSLDKNIFEPRPPDITFRYDFLFVIHFSNCLRRAHCELTE